MESLAQSFNIMGGESGMVKFELLTQKDKDNNLLDLVQEAIKQGYDL